MAITLPALHVTLTFIALGVRVHRAPGIAAVSTEVKVWLYNQATPANMFIVLLCIANLPGYSPAPTDAVLNVRPEVQCFCFRWTHLPFLPHLLFWFPPSLPFDFFPGAFRFGFLHCELIVQTDRIGVHSTIPPRVWTPPKRNSAEGGGKIF